MLGYHYTSIENYWHIASEGLVPYSINKPDLQPHFPDGITGIWLWKRDLVGDEHLGSILWQLMTKSSTRVVKLQVEYDPTKLLMRQGEPIEILHDGRLGVWVYHTKTPAIVCSEVIYPKHIHRLETFDLVGRLTE
jgi:hypothetical protein